MGDLSEHFSRREFACRCGCGLDTIDAETMRLCEIARAIEGGPAEVKSGHRCALHNAAVGGAVHSQHVLGRAADLGVSDPARVYQRLCDTFPDRYGFGLYATFVHVDSRGGPPARWKG